MRARVVGDLVLEREPGAPTPAHVSAASGLVACGRRLYVVVDDEVDLAVFDLADVRGPLRPGRLVPLLDERLPADHEQRKEAKPDFEALTLLPAHPGAPHGALLAVGSGSTPARRRGVRLPLDADGALHGFPEPIDLGPLYAELDPRVGELNVEGATVHGDELLLAQRGNGAEAIDAIAALDLAGTLERLAAGQPLDGELVRTLDRHELPEVGGVPASFTDLTTLPDGRVLFSAAGEDTDDPYVDGEITGSIVGLLEDPGAAQAVEPPVKVEGVWPLGDELLLCADADERAVPAPLLSASLAPFRRAG